MNIDNVLLRWGRVSGVLGTMRLYLHVTGSALARRVPLVVSTRMYIIVFTSERTL